MARVQVSDETWAAFRAQLGATPVSEALGRLVQREVGRAQRQSASDSAGVRLALEDARAVAAELASLISRLEGASDVLAPVPDGEPEDEDDPPPGTFDDF
jgi:hypothetical protein